MSWGGECVPLFSPFHCILRYNFLKVPNFLELCTQVIAINFGKVLHCSYSVFHVSGPRLKDALFKEYLIQDATFLLFELLLIFLSGNLLPITLTSLTFPSSSSLGVYRIPHPHPGLPHCSRGRHWCGICHMKQNRIMYFHVRI